MNATALHVFAVNSTSDVRHTNLTRAQGLDANLPPLEEWLGVDAVLSDRIEIFPVEDLGTMPLSDYIAMAFDPVPPPDAATRARIDALEGSVLLVPDSAVQSAPRPGANVTAIAVLPLAQPDHSADLPKAEVAPRGAPPPEPEVADPRPRKKGLSQGVKVAIFIAVFLALYIALDRF